MACAQLPNRSPRTALPDGEADGDEGTITVTLPNTPKNRAILEEIAERVLAQWEELP